MSKKTCGWIKLHRAMLDEDSSFQQLTVIQQAIAIHIILRANYEPSIWHDRRTCQTVEVKRGQLICSVSKILEWFKNDPDVSTKKVRTALERFKKLNFITHVSNNRYTVLNVVNYDVYQVADPAKADLQRVSDFSQKNGKLNGKLNGKPLMQSTIDSPLWSGKLNGKLNGKTPANTPATTKEVYNNINNIRAAGTRAHVRTHEANLNPAPAPEFSNDFVEVPPAVWESGQLAHEPAVKAEYGKALSELHAGKLLTFVSRATKLTQTEDQWLVEQAKSHLEGRQGARVNKLSSSLWQFITLNPAARKLIMNWLDKPQAERMAAWVCAQRAETIANELTYGLWLIRTRPPDFLKVLKQTEQTVSDGDLEAIV